MSDVPMTRPEEMLAEHETSYFMSSTFVELQDGRILHAAKTTFTTSDDGGVTWSAESERTDTNGAPVGGGGTCLVKLDGRRIGLAAMSGKSTPPPNESRAEKSRRLFEQSQSGHMLFWRSEDEGETWEPPVRINPPGLNTHAYQDVLLRTSSGRLVIPVYHMLGQNLPWQGAKEPASGRLINGQWVGTGAHFFDPLFSCVSVYYSDDEGRTWEQNRDGELVILRDWNAKFSFVNEPSLAEVAPGRLLMMMRSGLGRLFQAWSYDNGETWTRPQPTSLAATTTPAQIRSIPSTGHLLIVWNQDGEEDVKRGYNRQRLSSAVSRNGGSVWEFFQNVESMHEGTRVEPGPIRPIRPVESHLPPGVPAPERDPEYVRQSTYWARFAYPSMFVMKDRVLIAHTHSFAKEHPTLAEAKLNRDLPGGFNQKLKVLPISWFYGGKPPADSPVLAR